MTQKARRDPKLTAKGERTRQRIVEAAAELMFRNGVADTSLEAVKEGAGVSSSQIYHYFDDKRALVMAVIDYQTERVVGGQESMFDEFDTVDRLVKWRDVIVNHQRLLGFFGGCPLGSIGSELAELDEHARRRVAASFDRWEGGIRRGLTTMRQRGDLRGDPEDLALAMLAALQGGLLLMQVKRSTRPLEKALDTMIEHISSLCGAG